MTANVIISLNKGDFYETRTAYRMALIHSTCSSNLQSELYVSHADTSTAPPASGTSFSDNTIHHAEKQQLQWNWAMLLWLPLQSSLLQPPKLKVDNPTQWRTRRGATALPAWKIQGKLCFQGKLKMLKNLGRWKIFQYSKKFQGKFGFAGQVQVV